MTGIAGTRHHRRVIETGRKPGVLHMAEFAIVAALDMTWRLACRDHAIVTGKAGGHRRRVVEGRRGPSVGHMAGLAIVPRRQMIRVLARRGRSIVTAEAIGTDARMIESGGRGPGSIRMTKLTIVPGLQMTHVLTGCKGTVVAGHTGSHRRAMVEDRRRPAVGHMAGLAIVPCRQMTRVLALGRRTVMAVDAIRGDARMIEGGRRSPAPRRMADLAIIAGRNVVGVLSSRGRPVMTTHTIRSDEIVIKGRALPASRAVAISALIRTLDVIDGPVRSHAPDVTGLAILPNGGMVHPCRLPESSRVAVIAIGLDRDVTRRRTRFGSRAAACVTDLATRRCPRELPTDVAAFAVYPFMLPGKRKASEIMFKGRSGLRAGRRGNRG